MQNDGKRRVFVTGGDSAVSFSGSARFFMESLIKELPGFDVRPIPVHTYREMFRSTALWGASRRVDPRRYFFMTRQFQNANWAINGFGSRPDDVLISFLPVLIDNTSFDKTCLYVDMTFEQYLTYGQFADMPARIKRELIAQERASYAATDRIFAFTAEVRRQLVEDYGVPDNRVEVIGRGLNLPGRAATAKSRTSASGPLTIGFIGHDFERKGLLDLIAAIDGDEGLRSGIRVEVIGPAPEVLPARPYLTAHGYLDKDRRMADLLAIMDRCDVGYLFSKSEGVPGSVLEFLSRGIPCIISDIAPMENLTGVPGVETLPLAGGAAVVRDKLRQLLAAPERLSELKAAASASNFEGWTHQAAVVAEWCRAPADQNRRKAAA